MAGKIFVISDTHFGHNKEFLYKPRGFNSIEEHDEAIIERWNSVVDKDDDVYLLGDLTLGDKEYGKSCIARLNGYIHVILGNHDTTAREQMYVEDLDNIVEVNYATIIKYNKFHFYLSHYPTMTANLETESLYKCLINLYGHTHQKTNFYNEIPFMYHVGVDSHDCKPVLIDDIITDIKNKVADCLSYL